ncbi:uncharacterized protein LOC129775493 isoform X1 [Toxorhynchites rutilus septentrionalis]|uniref:uncharacterized protein LOC129775493 isoform X1 n=1 Tax=Toxorhynchites rutilus septentrionalis TaxID=329112 RepID=UPI002479845E|nr:uncharacterized protein LOC129775493 isoform X1 [Toxorhynchites rutilus septentrionalis]
MKCFILSVLAIVFLVQNSGCSPARYQNLPKKDGYVPVYIRVGNTPLEQINHELAAAFQESNARSIRGTLIQELNRKTRFSSESSSASSEETNNVNVILKRLNPSNRNVTDFNSSSDESNSSEQLLLNEIAALVKSTSTDKSAAVGNNII